MILPYYQMIVTLIVHITTISTKWVSYKGLWYFISDGNDMRNYMNAVDYCANLNSHLATVVDYDQRSFLMGYTGSSKYWIGLSTIHTNHTNNCNNTDMVWSDDYTCAIENILNPRRKEGANCSAYTLHKWSGEFSFTVADCNNRFGFICQWQCQTLGIISQHMSWITGVYNLRYYKSKRKFYAGTGSSSHTNKSLDYKCVWTWGSLYCQKGWVFVNETKNKLYYYPNQYHLIGNYTPYYQTKWAQYGDRSHIDVYFSCLDCQDYEITYSKGSSKNTSIVTKLENYDYINESDPRKPTLAFDHDSAMWCYAQQDTQILCFEYDITPVGYVSTFTSQDNTKTLTINCTTMRLRDDNDIDEFTTKSQKPQSVTTTAKLLSSEPGGTEEHQIVTTTHKPKIVSSSAYSIGIPTTHEIRSKYSSSPTTIAIVNTQNNDMSTKPTISDLFSPTTNKEHYLTSTKLTTVLLDLYSQTADPQSDALQNEQDNLKNSNNNIYIGVGIGLVLLIVFAVIIGVVIYKRRKASKGNTKNATQNLDDVHVITDTNIYSEPSFTEPPINRAPHIPVRNGLSSSTNTTENAPNIPRRNHAKSTNRAATEPGTNVDTILQSHSTIGAQSDKALNHGSSTDAHGSSNMPIYSEVNKNKKPVPPVPTEPVYSRVSKKAKTGNCENKQGNIHIGGANGSDSDIEFCDNDVYESERAPQGETQSNTGDSSDEEFSDNELYERGTPASAQRQTNVRTNVFDNTAYTVDPDDENIKMVDNDVYGQR